MPEIDEAAARALGAEKLGGRPNAVRATSWGWYLWRVEVGVDGAVNERVTVTREGVLDEVPVRVPRVVPAPAVDYRTMTTVEADLDAEDAFELAQNREYWPLTLTSTYRWGWVFHPEGPGGHPLPYGPGAVSVSRAGKVIAYGSLPQRFTDDEEPVSYSERQQAERARKGTLFGRLWKLVRREGDAG